MIPAVFLHLFDTNLTNFQTYNLVIIAKIEKNRDFQIFGKSQNPPYGLPYLRPNNEIIFRVC